ncbi:hypothetical protein C8E17_0746 [Serratia plymuthica]|uniref:Uncharacterized protein n=1 Tax=Serratia plymuthica TaxID=82996 RepID=A0A2X4V0I7_SERPL|nr:hypothetical protein C8E17_0746 [Serratia plymuthica]CAI2461741.1 Uncharacterised protein [Serratia plymuthica]SQI44581.1 Uncharacterised protein [Serratia plymuthica]
MSGLFRFGSQRVRSFSYGGIKKYSQTALPDLEKKINKVMVIVTTKQGFFMNTGIIPKNESSVESFVP